MGFNGLQADFQVLMGDAILGYNCNLGAMEEDRNGTN
jgi:hypothetical protein